MRGSVRRIHRRRRWKEVSCGHESHSKQDLPGERNPQPVVFDGTAAPVASTVDDLRMVTPMLVKGKNIQPNTLWKSMDNIIRQYAFGSRLMRRLTETSAASEKLRRFSRVHKEKTVDFLYPRH